MSEEVSVSSTPQHYDWTYLLGYSPEKLLIELAETHSAIANLIVQVGFLRQEELRGQQHTKEARIETEALRDAFVEKKWLLKAILGDSNG